MEHYRDLAPDRIQLLEKLVSELLKEKPAEVVVKKEMERLGLPYCTDSIERINRVLKALHPIS